MPGYRWILALDIGGTSMTASAFREDGGAPIGVQRAPTPVAEGPAGVVEAAGRLVEEARVRAIDEGVDARQIVGLGVGLPGAVDPSRGIVHQAPNLRWRDVPARDLFLDRLGLPVVVDNDANCAALGEWWGGAGRGSRFLIAITLGTGIGGGILDDGRVLRGATGAAGELGHLSINVEGRLCPCGNRGCIEAYCSGPSIAARTRERLAEGGDSTIRSMVDDDLGRITAELVTRAARGGDRCALEILTETAHLLGSGVASLVNVLNPDRVVLTGGVATAGDLLLKPLRNEVRRRAFTDSAEACVIAISREPELAGLRGAALAFRREALEGR